MHEILREIPLFAHLPDDDLDVLSRGVGSVVLSDGERLFREGDTGDVAFVIESGELEILKRSSDRDVLLAVRGPGEVVGEMALLEEADRMASARARGKVALISIDKAIIDELLATSTSAVDAMFKNILERVRSTESRLRQNERMAQLGTLTAGVAHELNNPAAAVQRAAGQLGEALASLESAEAIVSGTGLGDVAEETFQEMMESARAKPSHAIDSLGLSDLEDTITSWLEVRGIAEPWGLAPDLVDAGLTTADLDEALRTFGDEVANVLAALASSRRVGSLLHEIEVGSARISSIVKALKSYSYLDQAPVQDVDVIDGLEDTILIMKSKLGDVRLVRIYQENLPKIQAYGSELNQVWTNLIDNAVDAVSGTPDGEITLRVFVERDDLVVEIEDNGTGIPDAIQHRVFDSFFTTKPPGEGTGLGLDISYGIVAEKHGGDIELSSEPGRTVFRVTLPLDRKESS